MKKIIFSLVAVFLISALSFVSIARETVVNINSIPSKAQNFIKENFKDKKLLSTVKDSEALETEYKAYFADGTSINFNTKGEWKEVDGNINCIPTSFIPDEIINFTAENFPNVCICKIETEKEFSNRYYDIKLLNGTEVKFDKNGRFLGFED